jgi:NAD(P)-dependent dehydrogenase (short-subunit alcohol dehydrogenase family)
MPNLSGKTALVTGASSGIGFSVAKRLHAHGAHVIITGRREGEVRSAAAELGERAFGMAGDVADASHHAMVASEIARRWGGLDIYVANAGLNRVTQSSEVTQEEYDTLFDVNTRGVFFGVQAVGPHIRNGGSIIITGSIASEKPLNGHAVYAGTKAATGAFARNWALEFRQRGVRVNIVSPGPTETSIIEKQGIPEDQLENFKAAAAVGIPLGRLGQPGEIATAIVFLASDDSSFITGVNLKVDGGMTLL